MSKTIVNLPLTTHSGKIRVKKRKDIFYQGEQFSTKKIPLDSDCYFEWQISYDLKKKNNENFSKLIEKSKNPFEIIDENGINTDRFIYELSDYLFESFRFNLINFNQIKELLNYVKNQKEFIDEKLEILRSHPKEYKFGDLNFLKSMISYPLLIHEVKDLIVKVEIIVREKQRAIGIQPMLFICIPLKLAENFSEVENKLAKANQTLSYIINKKNIQVVIETFKIFSILSRNHNRDVVNILNTLIISINKGLLN
ncbi:MAG: hypothetical protein mread185_000325 [Mycoplasmataceae bacterium]|nr:MAG: hypothetical protein mread185_000325 [Mycoplasmataceae bacterium]